MRRRSFLKMVGAGMAVAMLPLQLPSRTTNEAGAGETFTFSAWAVNRSGSGSLFGFHAGGCWSGYVAVPDDGEKHYFVITTSPRFIRASVDGESVPIERATFNYGGWSFGRFGLSIYNPHATSFGAFHNPVVVTSGA